MADSTFYAKYGGLGGGSGGGVTSLNLLTGALTLVGAGGIAITPSGGNTLTITGTGGTVTSVSVVTANGLAGTVVNPTSTPAITLSTTVTGILQGNGTSISAATTGNLTSSNTTNLTVSGGTGAVLGSGAALTLTGANLTEATSAVLTITGGTAAVLGTGVTIQVLQSGTSQSGYLSSTDWNAFNAKQPAGSYVTTSEVGAANGVASLDGTGKVPVAQLPNAVFIYQGTWNPNTNTPTLADGTGTTGYTYWVSAARAAAVTGLNNASMINFNIGDLVLYNGTQYELTTPAAGVQSVNGSTGAVTINAINQLSGDGTTSAASGSQSLPFTLATVNSNVGSFTNASVTVNAKGLVTAASSATTTGTGSTVLATSPTISNPTVGTQAQMNGSTLAASTAYVDIAVANAVAGINPAVAVQAATTSAANTSGFTYNNGVSGVGATFTGTTNTAVVIDGFTFTALGQRLLVKNDTQSPSGAFNGIYYVTQLQTSLLPPILTRALDYDQPSDINNTGAIPVINGTVNNTTTWLQTAQIVTVGTTPLVFVQFSQNPALISPVTFSVDTSTTTVSTSSPFVYTNILNDSASGYNVTTGQYTIPSGQGGVWHFSAGVYVAGTLPIQIFQAGVAIRQGTGASSASPGIISTELVVTAGQTIDIRPQSGTATASGGSTLNYFSGFKIH